MSQTAAAQPASDPAPAEPEGPYVRALKIAVVVMGVMIVLGVLTVIGRIVYLGSQPSRQASISQSSARLPPLTRLALPQGAHVKQVSLSGDRLAVYYESAGSTGIAIVDLASGAVLSRVDVVPEVPR